MSLSVNRSQSPFTNIWSLRGRVLVIAEKPKAAMKIAYALSPNYVIRKYRNIPYYEVKQGDLTIVIASTVGHMYELYTNQSGYPVFDYTWIPSYEINREKQYSKPYHELLTHLFKTCQYYVNACDFDIEGSVIGYLLIKFHGDERRSYRAKFSSLTPQELRESFTKLTPLDYNMIEAGLCRHELDWIWGINLSRALMHAIQVSTNKRVILSVGRVQTPTLKFVVDHEVKRGLFIPIPQYSITAELVKDGQKIIAEYVGNPVDTIDEANKIKTILEKSKFLIVKSFDVHRQKYSPPPPFNLSDLQEEASRIYGLSPMRTQEIAEQLYIDALISYPRTNSQKLPPSLNYKEILSKLSRQSKYSQLVHRLLSETRGVLRPVEGEKEDPAHPAIYPTGVPPENLTREQAAIYDLIVRRFLAVFAPPAMISHIKAELKTPLMDYVFVTSGLNIEYEGWLAYYPFHRPSTKIIPRLEIGEKISIVKSRVRESYTKPSPRLKKIDILRWMESVEIGTESTRAIIIEKLFDRGYLKNTKSGIEISDLGIGVIEIAERFFPDLVSVELTRKFEILMNEIMRGHRSRESVINEAKSFIKQLVGSFNNHIVDVGLHLAKKLALFNNYKKCIIPECKGDEYKHGLCRIHYMAYENLLKTYEEWRRRKNIQFRDYVEKISRLKTTGRYVRDVVKYLEVLGKG